MEISYGETFLIEVTVTSLATDQRNCWVRLKGTPDSEHCFYIDQLQKARVDPMTEAEVL